MVPIIAIMIKLGIKHQEINRIVAAVASGDTQLVRKKLDHFDVNTRIFRGSHIESNSTLLIIAVKRSDVDMVRLLLRAGADPISQDNSGYAAIHYAAEGTSGNFLAELDILNDLVVYRKSLYLETTWGYTPMDLAIQKTHDKRIRTLQQKKIEVLKMALNDKTKGTQLILSLIHI